MASFLRWWGENLAAVFGSDGRSRPRLRMQVRRAEITIHGPGGDLLGRTARAGAPSAEGHESRESMRALLGPEGARGHPVRVAFDPGLCLTRELKLPLAAEENIDEVVSFELERHTPFRREQVYFSYRIDARDRASQRLEVTVCAAPRPVVDEALGLLPRTDLVPYHDGRIAADEIVFAPPGYRPGSARPLNILLGLAALGLLAAVVAVPLLEQRRMLDDLERRVAAARAEALEVSAIRDRVDRIRDELAKLQGLKSRRPPVVVSVDRIADLVPDGTWLDRLQIDGDSVTLQGISDSATALVPLFEAAPEFENARFTAPVTRDERLGGERFILALDLAAASEGEAPQ